MPRILRLVHIVLVLLNACCLGLAGCVPDPVAPAVVPEGRIKLSVPIVAPAAPSHQIPESSALPSAGVGLNFRDASEDWNFHFARFDDMRGQNRNMEVNGGGVAVFDYDLDGFLDVFLTQGGKLPVKKFTQELSNELFRNRGTLLKSETGGDLRSGKLQNMTALARLTATGFHTGCAVGDIDADGMPDLYVTAFGRSSLWQNQGDGTFRDISDGSGAVADTWGTSVAIADLNGDGWLDLYVTTYFKASDDPPLICSAASPSGTMPCSPTLFSALDDFLFVNDGQGKFIDVSKEAGITAPDGKGLGVVTIDINGDGKLDIFIANDMVPCFLYVNETELNGGAKIPGTEIVMPHFVERGAEFGIALNGEGRATAAMGIAHGDYDRDGWPDLFVTNYYLEVNTLFRNLGGQGFVDSSSTSRLGPPSRHTLAFGTEFLDVDHDGWLDLVITTGHIEDRTYTKNEPYRMRPHLFRNERNGRFTDVAETAGGYFAATWVGRSLATGDIDRDGDLDLVMAQQIDPAVLLLNETPPKDSSVIIKPVGRNGSPRNGVGSRLTAVKTKPSLVRVLAGGGGFQSSSAQEFHLALGQLKAFDDLELTWPDGHIDHWMNVGPGYYIAIEGQRLLGISGTSSAAQN